MKKLFVTVFMLSISAGSLFAQKYNAVEYSDSSYPNCGIKDDNNYYSSYPQRCHVCYYNPNGLDKICSYYESNNIILKVTFKFDGSMVEIYKDTSTEHKEIIYDKSRAMIAYGVGQADIKMQKQGKWQYLSSVDKDVEAHGYVDLYGKANEEYSDDVLNGGCAYYIVGRYNGNWSVTDKYTTGHYTMGVPDGKWETSPSTTGQGLSIADLPYLIATDYDNAMIWSPSNGRSGFVL